jgi:hypothetical protein
MEQVLVQDTNIEGRPLFQLIVPFSTNPCLIDYKGLLTIFSLAVRVQLQLGKKLSKRVNGLVGPVVLRHQWYERVLGHGHLAESQLGVRGDVLRGFEGGDRLQSNHVV